MTTLLTKTEAKAGGFHAHCRTGHWMPLHEVLTWAREDQPKYAQTRWDKALALEMILVHCDFQTDARDVFEKHMADVHGKKPRGPRQITKTSHRTRRTLSRGGEGKPYVPSKALAAHVDTCPHCGLVGDVRSLHSTTADELWWREHVEHCSERGQGAA